MTPRMLEPPRFSIAVLFRSISLIALALGCIAASTTLSPWTIFFGLLTLSVPLSLLVGWRRHGSNSTRISSAAWFELGFILLAAYVTYLAMIIQSLPDDNGYVFLGISFALLLLPVMASIFVYTLRAWTWSVHDQTIDRE